MFTFYDGEIETSLNTRRHARTDQVGPGSQLSSYKCLPMQPLACDHPDFTTEGGWVCPETKSLVHNTVEDCTNIPDGRFITTFRAPAGNVCTIFEYALRHFLQHCTER